MIGLGLRINRRKKVGGRLPFYSSLIYYAKKRIASDVIDEISRKITEEDKNG